MSENKVSVLLVCKEDSARTLLSLKFKSFKRLNVLGSCAIDNSLERFIKIYNPDVVVIYAVGNVRKEEFNCVLDIYGKFKSKILVIDTNPNEYDAHMFFRCGITAMTVSDNNLENLILDTSIIKNNYRYPWNKLPKVPLVKKLTINHRLYIDSLLEAYASKGRLISPAHTSEGHKYKLPYMNGSMKNRRYNIISQKKVIKERISNRIFPRNPDDLVDYNKLFPETFMKVGMHKGFDDKKQRFLMILDEKTIKNVKKMRKNDKKHLFLDKNPPIFDDFKYDEDASKYVVRYGKKEKK